MIIIGYPGVGKSTLSKKNKGIIDYDSSMFVKEDGWEESYVERAIGLSDQDYIVCVSCHKKVQDLLKDYKGKIVVVYPSLTLHDFWIDKLQTRYQKNHSSENKRALMRCLSNYCEDILELQELPYAKIEIKNEDYDLSELLNEINN